MSTLSEAATDYLLLRNRLGHDLAEYHRLLPRFVAYLDDISAPTVTVAAALAWAYGPDVDPATSVPARRMTIARGFAKHMTGIDPQTQIPPAGLVASPNRWHPPFIFEPADITALVTAAHGLRWPLPAATHATLIGLLAVSGMRIGEAIRLDRSDIDWQDGTLLIRESKFGKSRLVPVLTSTLTALDTYRRIREQKCPRPSTPAFFVSTRGNRMIYQSVHQVFRNLCSSTGTGAGAPRPPRIHDLRHTFAVRTLLGWYRAGEDVEAKLPTLSTYLGHRDPRSTYWYLSAAPELLGLAARRLEQSWQGVA